MDALVGTAAGTDGIHVLDHSRSVLVGTVTGQRSGGDPGAPTAQSQFGACRQPAAADARHSVVRRVHPVCLAEPVDPVAVAVSTVGPNRSRRRRDAGWSVALHVAVGCKLSAGGRGGE